ncbi:AAA family ATPase [Phytoactinopolyspora halotolerans]|uniref:AAA family ATPase n=1 Tax=Phytoactinopolyspora halotolerans TaxID=1981512 RepID=A0A6L9SJ83_9ACTN|nr:AAA family ATPase [Phytoactinopolyspora halotolerans]NEE04130.1 AAA family ATPase [Phytoactinopolyspora halotolerans]
MFVVLVTGASGAGKSAVSRWLAARGHDALSLDGYEGLCTWVDECGEAVQRPDHPSREWLSRHAWIWRPDVLDRLLEDARGRGTGTLWLAGHAENLEEVLDRFDLRVLLRIDQATLRSRLDDPSRGNDHGRVGASRAHVVATFEEFQSRLARCCEREVDATDELDVVGEALVRQVAPVRGRPGT